MSLPKLKKVCPIAQWSMLHLSGHNAHTFTLTLSLLSLFNEHHLQAFADNGTAENCTSNFNDIRTIIKASIGFI